MNKTLNQIEALALKLAENAALDATPVEVQVEAVKVLSPYYTLLKKQSGNEQEPSGDTIAALQAALKTVEETEHGNGTLPHRTRRRTILDEFGDAQPD